MWPRCRFMAVGALICETQERPSAIDDPAQFPAWQQSAAERIARLTRRPGLGRSRTVAFDLGISQRTVDNHRQAVMKRTGATTLPDLIRLVVAAAGARAPLI